VLQFHRWRMGCSRWRRCYSPCSRWTTTLSFCRGCDSGWPPSTRATTLHTPWNRRCTSSKVPHKIYIYYIIYYVRSLVPISADQPPAVPFVCLRDTFPLSQIAPRPWEKRAHHGGCHSSYSSPHTTLVEVNDEDTWNNKDFFAIPRIHKKCPEIWFLGILCLV